jgi:hypothetical protein
MAFRKASEDSISIEKQQEALAGTSEQAAKPDSIQTTDNVQNPAAMPAERGEKESVPGATESQQEDGQSAPAERMSAFQTVILTLALCVSQQPRLSLCRLQLTVLNSSASFSLPWMSQ